MYKSIVIGMGEVGKPLFEILHESYGEAVTSFDVKNGSFPFEVLFDVIHICFPYNNNFISNANEYQIALNAKSVIVHSTVPIGTTKQITNGVHSPVMGKHDNMKESMLSIPKWVGGKGKAMEIAFEYLKDGYLDVVRVDSSEHTEAMKLFSLVKYGALIALSRYMNEVCKNIGLDYEQVLFWDEYGYNEVVPAHLKRPLISPPEGKIGGHCVVPALTNLYNTHHNKILFEIIMQEYKDRLK